MEQRWVLCYVFAVMRHVHRCEGVVCLVHFVVLHAAWRTMPYKSLPAWYLQMPAVSDGADRIRTAGDGGIELSFLLQRSSLKADVPGRGRLGRELFENTPPGDIFIAQASLSATRMWAACCLHSERHGLKLLGGPSSHRNNGLATGCRSQIARRDERLHFSPHGMPFHERTRAGMLAALQGCMRLGGWGTLWRAHFLPWLACFMLWSSAASSSATLTASLTPSPTPSESSSTMPTSTATLTRQPLRTSTSTATHIGMLLGHVACTRAKGWKPGGSGSF